MNELLEQKIRRKLHEEGYNSRCSQRIKFVEKHRRKALNNSDTVSYETRYIVIKKAYEMGYSKLSPVVLNQFKLRNKIDETKTIVVLTRREISVFWNSIIMGISDELNTNGCKLQLNFISEQDEKNLVLPLDLQESKRNHYS